MAYRPVEQRMWGSKDFRRIPHGAPREVWFYLLTGNQTTLLPGLQKTTAVIISEETDLRPAEVTHALKTLVDLRLIEVDAEAKVIRVPNAPKYNPAANGKVIRGQFKLWSDFPETPLKYRHVPALWEALPDADWAMPAWEGTFGTVPESLIQSHLSGQDRVSIPNRFGIPGRDSFSGPQDQDQDHEQDQDQDQPSGAKPPSGSVSGQQGLFGKQIAPDEGKGSSGGAAPAAARREIDEEASITEVLTHWRLRAERPGWAIEGKGSEKRRSRIRSRLREGLSVTDLKLVADGMVKDDWLMGRKEGAPPGGYRDVETVYRDRPKCETLMALATGEARRLDPPAQDQLRSQSPDDVERLRQERLRRIEDEEEKKRRGAA